MHSPAGQSSIMKLDSKITIKALLDKFNIRPIGTVQDDIAAMMAGNWRTF